MAPARFFIGLFIGIVCLCITTTAQSQDTSVVITEVLVTGVRDSKQDQTSLHLTSISKTSIEQTGAFNLSDALSREPGVSQMTTGPAISKPIIRGLYGNRVLILVSSLKFDNQQWQDEHGLGLPDLGIARIELITGPASVLYGSDAIGGVVNVIEDQPNTGERSLTVHHRLYSNTLGDNISLGYKRQKNNHWWRVWAGYENHGDYSDGNNTRVLNSRFNGIYSKLGTGFTRGNWKSSFNYHFSLNQYGFILADLGTFFAPDARWSRSMAGPHHIVMLNLVAWENRITLKRSALKLNLGFQSNQRKEDEGGGSISLNMHLVSVPHSVQWIRPLNVRTELIISQIGSFENNTNYGGRKLIPDANMLEEGVAAFLKKSHEKWVLEVGAGVHLKYIKTFPTGILNTNPDRGILPFTKTNTSANGMAGISYLPNNHWRIKANVSSGHRAPNLAELSTNGLHEGTYQYEIGDPTLRNEQNINSEVGVAFKSAWLDVQINGYINQFFSFIYLAPSGEDYVGFQVFRYYQDKARLTGGEAVVKFRPVPVKGLEWTQTFSTVNGQLANGNYLPYIPANQWKHDIRYTFDVKDKLKQLYVFVSGNYVMKKTQVAVGETTTPAYFLLGAGLGGTIKVGKQRLEIYLSGQNLLNKNYYSHVSRLKAYGIYDMGRNLVLSVKIPINF
ncbi:TonB-dependent receptor [soil metagenome]